MSGPPCFCLGMSVPTLEANPPELWVLDLWLWGPNGNGLWPATMDQDSRSVCADRRLLSPLWGFHLAMTPASRAEPMNSSPVEWRCPGWMWNWSLVICHLHFLAHETQNNFSPFLSHYESSWRPRSCWELQRGLLACFCEECFLIFENWEELFALLSLASLSLPSSSSQASASIYYPNWALGFFFSKSSFLSPRDPHFC